MPFIKMEAGKMDQAQKETLIAGFTEVASATLGIPPEAFLVLIKENEMDNWGKGGRMLSKVLAEQKRGN
ncbi:Tautomerase enzyme [Acididesulfobacillus acetoxydans]|uniref:Interconverting Keto-and Enol-Groups n=1 Tax=Acididesulfobacillus acetoxydans TaxID=1561005 RepID=A0A8S0W887_9FIRM|nr:4-oxalocrotonate tautomerase DmpI [Acididesulfobacillus acetoxydans]CAA7601619.1 Tautomerase enzyme [Acididesulfobacillus acetoxydans]CEJ07106.1 Interconverting Keto-and Enol-Groups [Acididesulfobacillus acetoxydans]